MKKILCCCVVLFTLVAAFILADCSLAYSHTHSCSVPQTIYYAMPPEEDTVSPCSDYIQWRYKTIDGVLYRRKYNYTKNTWIGKWQKV